MTKIAAMPIYGKNPLKIFYPGTSGIISMKLSMNHQGLPPNIICYINLLKLLPWVDLDLFFSKVKFCNLGFYIEKYDSDGFFGNYCSL